MCAVRCITATERRGIGRGAGSGAVLHRHHRHSGDAAGTERRGWADEGRPVMTRTHQHCDAERGGNGRHERHRPVCAIPQARKTDVNQGYEWTAAE